MLNSWRRLRARLCGLLGHKWINNPHRKLCVYCWKEIAFRYVPPMSAEEQEAEGDDDAPFTPEELERDGEDRL